MQRSYLQLALVLAVATFGATGVQAADSPLDYQYFKTRVEPIFM